MIIGGISFIPNLKEVTGFDLAKFVIDISPWSYITLVLITIVFFQYLLNKEYINELYCYKNSASKEVLPSNKLLNRDETNVESLSSHDYQVLHDLSKLLPRDNVFVFFKNMKDDNSILIETYSTYKRCVERYQVVDTKFSCTSIEQTKVNFLKSLEALLKFIDQFFENVNPNKLKFYGLSVIKDNSIRFSDDYISGFRLLRQHIWQTESSWNQLYSTVMKEAPDYSWPN